MADDGQSHLYKVSPQCMTDIREAGATLLPLTLILNLTLYSLSQPSTFQLKEVILPVAIEEGVHRTESLSQVPTPEVKSPPVGQVTSQPLPSARLESDTTTSVHLESLSQSATSESSQRVGS